LEPPVLCHFQKLDFAVMPDASQEPADNLSPGQAKELEN
jgi:hypothetical protein